MKCTREKVKVDRVACPWLIQKFIDSEAEFIFLPADTNKVTKEGNEVTSATWAVPIRCVSFRSDSNIVGMSGPELGPHDRFWCKVAGCIASETDAWPWRPPSGTATGRSRTRRKRVSTAYSGLISFVRRLCFGW